MDPKMVNFSSSSQPIAPITVTKPKSFKKKRKSVDFIFYGRFLLTCYISVLIFFVGVEGWKEDSYGIIHNRDVIKQEGLEKLVAEEETDNIFEKKNVYVPQNLRRQRQAQEEQSFKRIFTPTKVAVVDARDPDEAYYDIDGLVVDGDPGPRISFLKFDIHCNNAPITKLKLKLLVTNPSSEGGKISKTNSDWGNNNDLLTFNTAPPAILVQDGVDISTVSFGQVMQGKVSIDLPISFVDEDGKLSFRIDPVNNNMVKYKKSNIKLIVRYGGTVEPNCDPINNLFSVEEAVEEVVKEAPPRSPPRNGNSRVVLKPTATFVVSNYPYNNYYNQSMIQVDDSPIMMVSFLKFDTHCVTGPVTHIELKLPCSNGSNEGGSISTTANSDWNADELTFENAPMPHIENITMIGRVNIGPTKNVTLPNFILNGTYGETLSLRIDPRSENGARYIKDEIEMIVTYDGDLSPGCSYLPNLPSDVPNPPTDVPNPPSDVPNPPSSDDDNDDYFQIKLYWEEGYCWQGICEERNFCVDCMNDCQSDEVKIRECDTQQLKQFWKWDDGKLESKKGFGFCMSYSDQPNPNGKNWFFMTECNEAKRFMALNLPPNPNKFVWHPLGDSNSCTTNRHHPRDNEPLYTGDCSDGERHDSGYWVTGVGWESLGGYELDNNNNKNIKKTRTQQQQLDNTAPTPVTDTLFT